MVTRRAFALLRALNVAPAFVSLWMYFVPKWIAEKYSEPVHFATFATIHGKFERDDGVMNVVAQRIGEMPVGKLVHASRDFH